MPKAPATERQIENLVNRGLTQDRAQSMNYNEAAFRLTNLQAASFVGKNEAARARRYKLPKVKHLAFRKKAT